MSTPGNDESLIALSSLSLGQKAQVVSFCFDTDQGENIQRTGLAPGEQLEIVRLPPTGDSIEIKIREYFFSLSIKDADHIKVRLLS
jgi:Fe2+ transport system protein FeoA